MFRHLCFAARFLAREGRRYPPKAVVGLAAGKLTGQTLGPYDFKGGLKSKCFRVLKANGFTIITKNKHKLCDFNVHPQGCSTTVENFLKLVFIFWLNMIMIFSHVCQI